jgi:hypothetical protein
MDVQWYVKDSHSLFEKGKCNTQKKESGIIACNRHFLDGWKNSVTTTLLHTLGSLSPPVPGTSTLEILLPSLSPVTGSTEWTVVP